MARIRHPSPVRLFSPPLPQGGAVSRLGAQLGDPLFSARYPVVGARYRLFLAASLAQPLAGEKRPLAEYANSVAHSSRLPRRLALAVPGPPAWLIAHVNSLRARTVGTDIQTGPMPIW